MNMHTTLIAATNASHVNVMQREERKCTRETWKWRWKIALESAVHHSRALAESRNTHTKHKWVAKLAEEKLQQLEPHQNFGTIILGECENHLKIF